MLGPRLATLHNIQYYLDLVRGARDAILAGAFDSYRSRCIEAWSRRDD
jgi:queuine tRNA-ribosyltransferase